MTNKVYIVEEYTWDHHENVAVFASKQKAIDFCDLNYDRSHNENEERWCTNSYNYEIEEYDVQE